MNRRRVTEKGVRGGPNPEGPIDHTVPVLRVDSIDRKNLRAVVFGYCNALPTYIPSMRVLHEGGYEGGDHRRYTNFAAPFDESIEQRIVGKVHELNKRLGGE